MAYRVTSENRYFPNFSTQCETTDADVIPPYPLKRKYRKKQVVGNEFKSISFGKNILKKLLENFFKKIIFTSKTFFVKNFLLKYINFITDG